MRSIIIYIFLFISTPSFGQFNWINLPEEDQAERAMEEGNYPLAIQLYENALEIRKAKYPDDNFHCNVYALREVSEALDHLIMAHNKAGNYAIRLELCEQLSLWSEEGMRLYPHEPNTYLEYGFAQIKMAESYHSLKQYDKGLQVCQKLLRFFQNTGEVKPFKFVSKQIIPFTHVRAGKILKDKGDLEASVIQHKKSIVAFQNILKEIKEVYLYEEIGKQARNCVRRYEALKDTTNVLKYAKLAKKQYEILLDIEPDNEEYINELKLAEYSLASHNFFRKNYEKAIEPYKKGLLLNEKQLVKNGKVDTAILEQMVAINMVVSDCYRALKDTLKSAEHLSTRIEQLKQLQELLPSKDYQYTISRNQYQLAEKYKELKLYPKALVALDESIISGQKAIERDTQTVRKKEWQWIQEFYRYQLLRDMEDYEMAHNSLERLKNLFNSLEKLEKGIQYSEHIREIEISSRILAYPDFVKMDAEIKAMEDGKMKFEKSMILVKLLKKKMRKDRSMQFPYVRYTSELAWSGLLAGEYKESKKVIKKAMKIKPVDPYLITNYAPCLLFLGKYKKAEKVYSRNYDKPFTPGKKIIYGFIDDLEKFEENGAIPSKHQEKVEEIKAKLDSWNTK